MSKTFKSVTDNESELDVRANDCGVFIAFSRAGQIRQASTFAPSDAPALALAILEAAGHGKASDSSRLMQAFDLIELHVAKQERITAEAKEQAELEAEARDFYDVYRSADNWPYQDWVMLEALYKAQFIAVASRAREMRAEK